VEKDKMIEENIKAKLDVIEVTTQFNRQIANDIHIQECQIEAIRELNKQFSITLFLASNDWKRSVLNNE
jgi:hypothetical protein